MTGFFPGKHMNVDIRKLKKKDIPRVQRIARRSWQTTYEGIIPKKIQDEFIADYYSKRMLKKRRCNNHFLVAEKEGKMVGFAEYTKILPDGSVHLHAIYLDPDYLRQGIGSALIRFAMENFDANIMTLHVVRQNERAIRFYEKTGFKAVDEFVEDWNGHPLHMIRMRLMLEI